MSNIIELPPIEEWDSDNECLYYYGKAIEGEDGKCEVEIFKMPFPIPEVFYRRRKIPYNMLNLKQYNECKYCGKILFDGYWRRMAMCRDCSLKKPWQKKLF